MVSKLAVKFFKDLPPDQNEKSLPLEWPAQVRELADDDVVPDGWTEMTIAEYEAHKNTWKADHEAAMTAWKALDDQNNYGLYRKNAYRRAWKVEDQIDLISKFAKTLKAQGINLGQEADNWIAHIDAIKTTYPKPEGN